MEIQSRIIECVSARRRLLESVRAANEALRVLARLGISPEIHVCANTPELGARSVIHVGAFPEREMKVKNLPGD